MTPKTKALQYIQILRRLDVDFGIFIIVDDGITIIVGTILVVFIVIMKELIKKELW